jgi:hypothetical protein
MVLDALDKNAANFPGICPCIRISGAWCPVMRTL